jgi:hypothetical protein
MNDVKTSELKTSDVKTSQEDALARLPRGEVSPFDLVDTHPEDDVVADPRQAEMQKQLDKGLKDSFPASDPVSALQPITAGPTEEGSEALAAEEDGGADDAGAMGQARASQGTG